VKAIVAMSENRVIGADGKIPWHLSEDLKFFKRTTLGHVILMGRKTYDSIGRPLPGRENWVVSRTADYPGVRMIRNLEDIREPGDGRELFLIGGAELYRALLPQCAELYLTQVRREVEGDAFFPAFEDEFAAAEVLMETPEMVIRRWVRK
jgi:dihydrofolate reductase